MATPLFSTEFTIEDLGLHDDFEKIVNAEIHSDRSTTFLSKTIQIYEALQHNRFNRKPNWFRRMRRMKIRGEPTGDRVRSGESNLPLRSC
jgi:hypothetical protein